MSCNKQLSAVASSLGSSGVSDLEKRPFGYWTDISNLERELNAYIDAHGTPGVMPGLAELTANGRTDLICAFRRFGGTGAVARRAAVDRRPPPRSFGRRYAFRMGTFLCRSDIEAAQLCQFSGLGRDRGMEKRARSPAAGSLV